MKLLLVSLVILTRGAVLDALKADQAVVLERGAVQYADVVLSRIIWSSSVIAIQGSHDSRLDATQSSPSEYVLTDAWVKLSDLTLYTTSLGEVPGVLPRTLTSLNQNWSSYQPTALPAPLFLHLPWLTLNNGSRLAYQAVDIVTGCDTLVLYQRYLCDANWNSNVQINATHIAIRNWRSDSVTAVNVTLTCVSEASSPPLLNGCAMTTASDDLSLHSALSLQHTFQQVVVVLTGNITLSYRGPWDPALLPYTITKLVVLAGEHSDQRPVIDFNLRSDVLSFSGDGACVMQYITTTGHTYGSGVEATPPLWFQFDMVSAVYASLPFPPGRTVIFGYNVTVTLACVDLEYAMVWVGKRASGSALLQQQAAWLEVFLKTMVVGASVANGMMMSVSNGLRDRIKNFWLRCDAPGVKTYTYNFMEMTNGELPLTQAAGAASAGNLMTQMAYMQSVPLGVGPDWYLIIIIGNITFADLATASEGQPAYVNGQSESLTLNRSVTWTRWMTQYIVIDFAGQAGLFVITPSVKLTIRHITLTGLPCRCDGTLLGLWGAALWPFTYDRLAPNYLMMQDTTLMLSQPELDFLHHLINDSSHANNISRDALGWPRGTAQLMPTTDSPWQLLRLDGLGYETINITITTPSPRDPPAAARSASRDMFQAMLIGGGTTQTPHNDDDGSGSQPWLGAVLGTVVGVAGLAVLAVLAMVGFRWCKARRTVNEGHEGTVIHEGASCTSSKQSVNVGRKRLLSHEGASGNTDRRRSGASVAMQPTSATLSQGDLFDGIRPASNVLHLTIKREIATGATSKVYLGEWRGLSVAIKVILLESAGLCNSVAKEAGLLTSLSHPNIVAIYHYGFGDAANSSDRFIMDMMDAGVLGPNSASSTTQGAPSSCLLVYLVQEYCDLGTLRQVIDGECDAVSLRITAPPTKADADDIGEDPQYQLLLGVACDIAEALSHLHSKDVIHGDVTPNNILIKSVPPPLPVAGEVPKVTRPFDVKVADFGLSEALPHGQTHKSNINTGTMYYVAPEVLLKGILGKAADVFSFGIILWELYHGTPTWRKRRVPPTLNVSGLLSFAETCPGEYVELCRSCMADDPQQRPTMAQVLKTIRGMRGEEETGSPERSGNLVVLDLDRAPNCNSGGQQSWRGGGWSALFKSTFRATYAATDSSTSLK